VVDNCGFNSKSGLMGEENRLAIATFEDLRGREELDLVIGFRAKFLNMRTPNIVLEVGADQACEHPLVYHIRS